MKHGHLHTSLDIPNQPALNKGRVESIAFPLAPLPEQEMLVSIISEVLIRVELLETIATFEMGHLQTLNQSILAKAFRGELVPIEAELARQEGRPYEPASDLLKRIQAERNGKKGTNNKKAAKHKQQVGQLNLDI